MPAFMACISAMPAIPRRSRCWHRKAAAIRFSTIPRAKVARRGLRGSSAAFAAQIWGMGGAEYCAKADLYPLNPNGQLIFGVKIEDTLADPNCDATISVPGVAFAEYGPGDHAYWLYGLAGMQPGARVAAAFPDVAEARPELAKVRQAVTRLVQEA